MKAIDETELLGTSDMESTVSEIEWSRIVKYECDIRRRHVKF